MNTGNYVSSIRFSSPGIVVKKWVDESRGRIYPRSYQFTIDLLENTGKVITLDIHNDDEWEVLL